MTIEFDSWLDDELESGFASFSAAPIPAGAQYRSWRPASARPWFLGRVATRTVVILVVAALGLIASSAFAAAAVTGTIDPQAWTRQIIKAVDTCSAAGAPGKGGVASCVNAVVHSQRPKSPDQRSPSVAGNGQPLPAPSPNAPPGSPPTDIKPGGPGGVPAGTDTNAPHGRPTNIPSGPPTGVPQGRPSNLPVGPPTGHVRPPKVQPPKGR
jgi:hypothetical protein